MCIAIIVLECVQSLNDIHMRFDPIDKEQGMALQNETLSGIWHKHSILLWV